MKLDAPFPIGISLLLAGVCCALDGPPTDRGDTAPPIDSDPDTGDSAAPVETGDDSGHQSGDTGSPEDTGDSVPVDTGEAWEPEVQLHVELGGVDEGNDCLDPASPCASLSHALAQAATLGESTHKQLLVGPGSHAVQGLVLEGVPNLHITGSGVGNSTLQGPYPSQVTPSLPLLTIQSDQVVVEGFTIRGIAADAGSGAGISVEGSELWIALRDLRFDGRLDDGNAGGMGVQVRGGDPKLPIHVDIERVQILFFTIKAGILVKGSASQTHISSSTFYGNDCGLGITPGVDGLSDGLVQVTVIDSIFSENDIGLSICDLQQHETSTLVSYSMFSNNLVDVENVAEGEGLFTTADPHFRDAPEDLSLESTGSGDVHCSPGINAGSPESSYRAEPAPNGGRIDLGHLGGSSAASFSC